MKDKNYVIIGNSTAGISAAETIREIDITGKSTIIFEENFPAYSHLFISDYLKDKVVLDNISYKDKSFFQRNNINTVIGVKIQKIDTNTHTVLLSTGEQLKYDKLLLATGSIPFIPNIKGIKDKQNCYTFLNMKSGSDIKNAVNNTDVVIIGGGLIGLKIAEGLSKICKSVTVCELSNRLLAAILDKPAGDLIGKHIKKHGINYYTKNTVIEAVCKDNKITGVILKDGRQLNCSMLIMAAGARPNIKLAKQMGVDIGQGIKTNKRQMTSILDVYAAGDCTESIDTLDNSAKIMTLWPDAVMQGKIAGNVMAGGDKCFDGAFAMNTIDFFGFIL